MDLNFTFSPSPTKRYRPLLSPTESPLKFGSPTSSVKNSARDLLSGALNDAIKKDDDEELYPEVDSLSSPLKRLIGSGMSPFPSPSKSGKKRKRRSEEKVDAGYHHTFVMKLFDRSVDLAQFRDEMEPRSSYPLYPVARAWIRNEPNNVSQAPRPRSPTPDQTSDSETDDIVDTVYKLPPPSPLPAGTTNMRIPDTPPVTKSIELDLDLDQANAPPKELLLSNHLVRWWGVRKSWKKAGSDNEKRYEKSLTILKDMYEK